MCYTYFFFKSPTGNHADIDGGMCRRGHEPLLVQELHGELLGPVLQRQRVHHGELDGGLDHAVDLNLN